MNILTVYNYESVLIRNKREFVKLINEFYFTSNCIITDENKVVNTKLNKELGEVKQERKRLVYYATK